MVRTHRFENYNKFFFIIGIFILNWLYCQIDPHNITDPSQRYPDITLGDSHKGTIIKCEKFHAEKKKIMRELNINQVSLSKHHVVLRRKKLNMPVLMASEARTQGKFFKFLVTSSNVIFLFSKSLV
jgi:hypothetical protein